MGLRLQRAGVPFTIFEKGSEVGGTWRDNRYPGLTIDVPSPLYTFAEHRYRGWRRWMPDWREILDYHCDVATRTGLRERIRFDSEVVAATWTGADWEIETAAGDTERFRVLVCATGFLHHPRIPDFDGLESFAGELVHSSLDGTTVMSAAMENWRAMEGPASSATARPACSSSARSAVSPRT